MIVKSYKKGLVAKKLKYITNHSLKLAKLFSQYPIPFKANALLHSNASQYYGAIKAGRKFVFPINRQRKAF